MGLKNYCFFYFFYIQAIVISLTVISSNLFIYKILCCPNLVIYKHKVSRQVQNERCLSSVNLAVKFEWAEVMSVL